jgi:transcriptional regulator of acetoin/glycerol metabolism
MLDTVRDPALFRQRESFLSGGAMDERVRVRPEILDSWRRSMSCAVNPQESGPEFVDINTDSRLTEAAVPIIDRAFETIESGTAALVLTDANGIVLRRWSNGGWLNRALGEPFAQTGYSLAEASVGTNAIGIVQETARPILIGGAEHYSDSFLPLVCAGCPIFHPISAKLIGILDVTCKVADTHTVLLPWVCKLAEDIQRCLLDRSSRSDQMLMDEYMRASRAPSRLPVICLNDRTIIATPSAARVVDGVNQAFLWEHVGRAIGKVGSETFDLPLTSGDAVTIHCRPICDDGKTVGAVVQLVDRPASRAPIARTTAMTARLESLGGQSAAWRTMCEELARGKELGVPLLLRGEPGTGKFTLAEATYPDNELIVVDAATAYAEDVSQWFGRLQRALDAAPSTVVVIRHLDALEPRHKRVVSATIERHVDLGRKLIVVTESVAAGSVGHSAVDDFTGVAITVPALSDRQEDLPHILESLSLSLSLSGRPRRWRTDAIQAISRAEWPGNVRQLRNIVRGVINAHPAGDIGAKQLPVNLLTDTPRRNLARLERLEFNAIIAALRRFNGNKVEVADYLQISRSTLYRKMKMFGLDLDRWAY